MDEFDIGENNDTERAWNHGHSWTSTERRDLVRLVQDPLDAKQILAFASSHGRKAYSAFNKFVEIMWLNLYHGDSVIFDRVEKVTQKYV